MSDRIWEQILEYSTTEISYEREGVHSAVLRLNKSYLDLVGVSADVFFKEAKDRGYTEVIVTADNPVRRGLVFTEEGVELR